MWIKKDYKTKRVGGGMAKVAAILLTQKK